MNRPSMVATSPLGRSGAVARCAGGPTYEISSTRATRTRQRRMAHGLLPLGPCGVLGPASPRPGVRRDPPPRARPRNRAPRSPRVAAAAARRSGGPPPNRRWCTPRASGPRAPPIAGSAPADPPDPHPVARSCHRTPPQAFCDTARAQISIRRRAPPRSIWNPEPDQHQDSSDTKNSCLWVRPHRLTRDRSVPCRDPVHILALLSGRRRVDLLFGQLTPSTPKTSTTRL